VAYLGGGSFSTTMSNTRPDLSGLKDFYKEEQTILSHAALQWLNMKPYPDPD